MAIESKNLLVWVKAMSRGQGFPLDASEIYSTLSEAENYASNSAIAYGGQTVKALTEDGKYHSYVLQPSESGYTLEEVGAVNESDLKQYVMVVDALPESGQVEGILYINNTDGYVWTGSAWRKVFWDITSDVTAVSNRGSELETGIEAKAPIENPVFTGIVKVGEEEVAVKSYVDSKQTQPDWNQNDTAAADYVKNRPFYTGNPVETVIVEESTVAFEDGGGVYIAEWPYSLDWIEGQTYTVKFDGTSYDCVCRVVDGSMIVIGNLSIAGAGDDSGEPFIIINQGAWLTATLDTSASHVISISKSDQEVKKSDSKYIDFPAETDPTVPAWAKDDHKPTYTASEVGALPSDTVIPVIITYDASGNLSHTFSQIQTLISNGKTCIVLDKKNKMSYLYFGNGSNYIKFRNSNIEFSISKTGTVSITDIPMYDLPVASSTKRGGIRLGDGLKIKKLDSDVVSVSDDYVNTLIDAKLAEEIPTELPNPAALTFTGAVTGTYDGSEALTVEIPTPDVSGQISTHNSDTSAHSDIRTSISNLNTLVGETPVSDQISTAISAIDHPVESVNGKTGAVVLTASDFGIGGPTDDQVNSAVSAWLTEHPEATTTVQDGSVSEEKTTFFTKSFVELIGKMEVGFQDTSLSGYHKKTFAVEPGKTYILNGGQWFTYYDSNMTDISGAADWTFVNSGLSIPSTNGKQYINKILTVPEGSELRYIRITVQDGGMTDSYPSCYEGPTNIGLIPRGSSLTTFDYANNKKVQNAFEVYSGENLIDASQCTLNSGNIYYSQLIPVQPGEKYYKAYKPGGLELFNYYGQGFPYKWTAGVDWFPSTGTVVTGRNDGVYIIPENAYYARTGCTMTDGAVNEWFVKSPKIITSVQVGKPFIASDAERNTVKEYLDGQHLVGLKLCCLGDSVTNKSQYGSAIADRYNMTNIAGGTDGASYTSATGLNSNQIAYNKVNSLDADTDVVVLMFGTNDISNSRAIGSFTDNDLTTLYGALRKTYDLLTTKFSGKRIGVVTSPQRNFNTVSYDTCKQYNDVIKKMAMLYKIPVLDGEYAGLVYGLSNDYSHFTDDVHPSSTGSAALAYNIGKFIETLPIYYRDGN